MKTARLHPALPVTSVLGFGCAPLGGRVSARDGLRALGMAWDAGVRLFDTARSYGYGESERILGRFLAERGRGWRDEVVIATKAGIRAPRPNAARRFAKGVARRVFDVAPGLRGRLRGALGRHHQGGRFSAAELRASVEESLRELGVDYVDLLFLHECTPEVVRDEEVLGLLDDLRDRGLIRLWGVAGAPEVARAALAEPRAASLGAIQVPYSLWHQGAAALAPALAASSRPLAVLAHQPFAGGGGLAGLARDLDALAEEAPELAARLRDGGPQGAVDAAILAVARGPLAPAVICSMTRPEHVHANARALTHGTFTDDELTTIRAFFGARAAGSTGRAGA